MPGSITEYNDSKLLIVDSQGNYKQLLPETQPGNVINLATWIHANAPSVLLGTLAEFTAEGTVVIPENCLAIETDTGAVKMGDGSTTWVNLSYANLAASKLKTSRLVDGMSFDGTANVNRYGVSSSLAATAAKTVSITGFNLVAGAHVYVKFTEDNTATNPTLNVNNTGDVAIYDQNGTNIRSNKLKAGPVYCFIYNGSQFEVFGSVGGDGSLDEMLLTDIVTGTDTTAMSLAPKTLNDAFSALLGPVYMDKDDFYDENPVIRNGILAIESDTGRVKIGNGVSRYKALPYTSMQLYLSAADQLLAGYTITLNPGEADQISAETASTLRLELRVKDANGDYNPV